MERNITKRLSVWAIVVAAVLMIPLIAMRFTTEVNWTAGDFIFGAIVLFGFAAIYEVATRNIVNKNDRIAVAVAVFLVLAFVWVGAATGFAGVFDRINQAQER
jgi:hypothetical protein